MFSFIKYQRSNLSSQAFTINIRLSSEFSSRLNSHLERKISRINNFVILFLKKNIVKSFDFIFCYIYIYIKYE